MKYTDITHFSHPHRLHFASMDLPFKCDGCKEVGIGSRYKCRTCDYDLHLACAGNPSAAPVSHPFYPKCSFHFSVRPPGEKLRFCNACEKDVSGFVYHCGSCGFDLHPCCLRLPVALDDAGTKLYLYKKASSPCHRCGRKGRSWCYRSACKRYLMHVACARETVMEGWQETKMPSLKAAFQFKGGQKRSKGKVQRCYEVAGFALQVVVAAVLGDPTALIAGVVGSLISR